MRKRLHPSGACTASAMHSVVAVGHELAVADLDHRTGAGPVPRADRGRRLRGAAGRVRRGGRRPGLRRAGRHHGRGQGLRRGYRRGDRLPGDGRCQAPQPRLGAREDRHRPVRLARPARRGGSADDDQADGRAHLAARGSPAAGRLPPGAQGPVRPVRGRRGADHARPGDGASWPRRSGCTTAAPRCSRRSGWARTATSSGSTSSAPWSWTPSSARTELLASNDSDGVLFKLRKDPRVTTVGAHLRRWSVDELPQLFNVFLGHMSLVGPRPALPDEAAKYAEHVRRRLVVKPGLTGLWQVNGRSDLSWEESVRLDLRYVENWSFALDLQILWKTISGATAGGRGLLTTAGHARRQCRRHDLRMTDVSEFRCRARSARPSRIREREQLADVSLYRRKENDEWWSRA